MDPALLRSLAESSLPAIDELYSAIASTNHVEEACLRKVLELKLVREIEMTPVQRKLEDITTKSELWRLRKGDLERWSPSYFWACDWQRSYDLSIEGIEKSGILEAEAKTESEAVKEKMRDIQPSVDKLAIDMRSLEKYRENFIEVSNPIFEGNNFPGDKAIQVEIEEINTEIAHLDDDNSRLEKISSLLRLAFTSILSGIVLVRNRIDGGAQAGVYFPEDAYNAVKEARKLYPLPNVTRPGKMSDKPDETGAEYTPTQLYLWDSKKSLYELAEWVHEKYIENERELVEKRIELGKKTDKLAAERRRMLREAAGKN